MLNKKLFLIIIAILSTQIVFGAVIHRQYDFSAPQVILNHGRSELVMEGCLTAGKPGNPPLPQFPIKLLLPPGEAITEVIISPQELTVSHTGVTLDPALNLYPFSYQGEIAPTIPNPLIYQTDGYYPSDLIESYQTQYLCGHSIGYVTIYPVQYNPMSGEIAYFKYIKVTVITAPYNRAQEAYNSNYRSRNSDRSRVERIVENDEAVQQYGVLDETDDPVVPYLIMVPQDMYYSLQPLADFKTQRGMITELYLLEDVFLNYTGMDIQDQIRNCIIDYYQNYGTEYVLLAGDDEYILHRGLFASDPQMEEDIAADIYYAGLDGNWNIDGDQWWGEPFEADLLAEVYVGRCASDSPTEAANFVNKQIGYQSTPVFNELATALMVGEDLGWAVWGSEIKEEVRNGSSSAGYTSAGISANFTVNTLYDTPTWSFSGTGNLIPLLNGGPNLVNHMGHASRSYMMKLNTSQVNSGSCTNNGSNANYYIVYSQGCYCGSFDNRNANGSYGTDCITEKFSIIETGAVAMITNSRYGWGNGYNTNGPSQYYDRQFYDAIFGENITIIGQTNQDSKEDNIPFIGSATYWCYYQLNLFADPTLDIWTAEPVELIPVCQNFIGVGMDFFELQIPGVQGAWCALVSNNELLGWAQTDANGNAVIELNEPITSVIPLTLNITAHNYIPYSEPLDVVNLSYPFMMPELNSIGDGITGDGDGILDLGEIAYLVFQFSNVGGELVQGAMACLTSQDNHLIVVDDSLFLGDIQAGSSVIVDDYFRVQASENVPDGYWAGFTMEVWDTSDSIWSRNFSVQIEAPVLALDELQILDYENGVFSPGENLDISIELVNEGSGEARAPYASLMTDNDHITFNTSSSSAAFIASGAAAQFEPLFNLTINSDCPAYTIIPIYLNVTDSMGYSANFLFEIMASGFFDCFETGIGAWTHSAVTAGYSDQWIMSNYRNHTVNGATAWHCGSDNGGNYGNSVDAGLVSPVVVIPQNAYLEFWHYMDAELHYGSFIEAYDGGMVQMSINGSPFVQIAPVGYYPCYIVNRPSPGPFSNGTAVFSGNTNGWQKVEFSLANFAGANLQFRFRFGSDYTGVDEGWYIDDVRITCKSDVEPPANFTGYLTQHIVLLTWETPNNTSALDKSFTRGTESLLYYNIYRNGELFAENVQALSWQDYLYGLPSGTYVYQVGSVFEQGESGLTYPVFIEYEGIYDNPQTTGIEVSGLIPLDFYFDDNYPNPFNCETMFKYGLPQGGEVTLEVYDVLGRKIAALVEGFQEAGNYSIAWNAADMPSGIYIYRMTAGEYSAKGKVVLLK